MSSVPFTDRRRPAAEMIAVAESFADVMSSRRSVRDFSPEPVPDAVIDAAVRAAATAPSGANIQPWRFVVLTDPATKQQLRRRPRPRSGSSTSDAHRRSGGRR